MLHIHQAPGPSYSICSPLLCIEKWGRFFCQRAAQHCWFVSVFHECNFTLQKEARQEGSSGSGQPRERFGVMHFAHEIKPESFAYLGFSPVSPWIDVNIGKGTKFFPESQHQRHSKRESFPANSLVQATFCVLQELKSVKWEDFRLSNA